MLSRLIQPKFAHGHAFYLLTQTISIFTAETIQERKGPSIVNTVGNISTSAEYHDKLKDTHSLTLYDFLGLKHSLMKMVICVLLFSCSVNEDGARLSVASGSCRLWVTRLIWKSLHDDGPHHPPPTTHQPVRTSLGGEDTSASCSLQSIPFTGKVQLQLE